MYYKNVLVYSLSDFKILSNLHGSKKIKIISPACDDVAKKRQETDEREHIMYDVQLHLKPKEYIQHLTPEQNLNYFSVTDVEEVDGVTPKTKLQSIKVTVSQFVHSCFCSLCLFTCALHLHTVVLKSPTFRFKYLKKEKHL